MSHQNPPDLTSPACSLSLSTQRAKLCSSIYTQVSPPPGSLLLLPAVTVAPSERFYFQFTLWFFQTESPFHIVVAPGPSQLCLHSTLCLSLRASFLIHLPVQLCGYLSHTATLQGRHLHSCLTDKGSERLSNSPEVTQLKNGSQECHLCPFGSKGPALSTVYSVVPVSPIVSTVSDAWSALGKSHDGTRLRSQAGPRSQGRVQL